MKTATTTTTITTSNNNNKNKKGMIANNYKPIACLDVMWTILTSLIEEEICYSNVCSWMPSKEKKEYRKDTRATNDLQ